MDKDGNKIQWHMAFTAAFQIELIDDADKLQYIAEYQLARKPMSVDLVIIKNQTKDKLSKNIGHIFKKHNLVQYKSPEDYLSIRAFYKTYGYACFYLADSEEHISPEEVTLTYVCNRYPYKLFRYLELKKRLTKRKYGEGIYYFEGDQFAIQVLITKELSKEENYWMQSLRSDLKAGGELREFIERYDSHKMSEMYKAVANAVLRANWIELEKEKNMCEALRELFKDELEDAGNNGRNEGKIEKIISNVIKKMNKGKTIPVIAEELEEEVSIINKICDLMKAYHDKTAEELAVLYLENADAA